MFPSWKANKNHLKVGLSRLVVNYIVHSGVSKSEAIATIRNILNEIEKEV